MTVDDDLRRALLGSNSSKLDSKLSNSLSIVNQSISFVPGSKPFDNETNVLKSKYIFVNVKKPIPPELISHDLHNKNNLAKGFIKSDSDTFNARKCDGPQVPLPQFIIYPEEAVKLTWEENSRKGTGVGLNNLGNTCFLNSILQVLTNSAPLVNYLFSDHHASNACPLQNGFCAVCALRTHVKRIRSAAESRTDSISPQNIVSKLRCVMKNHGFGRQEDAHEFLRYFVDSMQNACLFMFKDKKLDLFTKETSPIGRIFGGYHKNDITCLCCKSVSTTFDPFLDISLEIKKFDNIEQSFRHFTRMETLTGDNAYKCPRCNKKVTAHKSYSIHEAPNILTIQLKRFDHFGKIDKSVSFSEKLNLRPFMSQKQGRSVNYKLYGVVVHSGRSTNSGHYFAFVRNPLDQWHLMDDSRVCVVSPKNVLHSAAYLLFYVRLPLQMATVKPQPQQWAVKLQEGNQGDLPINNDLKINSSAKMINDAIVIKSNPAALSLEPYACSNYKGVTITSTPVVHAVAPLPQFVPRPLSSNNSIQRNILNVANDKAAQIVAAAQRQTKINLIYHNNNNSNNNSKFVPSVDNQPMVFPDGKRTTDVIQENLCTFNNRAIVESPKPSRSADSHTNPDNATNLDANSTTAKANATIKSGLSADSGCDSTKKIVNQDRNVEKRLLSDENGEESKRKKRRRKEKERKKKHKRDEKRERSSSSHRSKSHSQSHDEKQKISSKKRRRSPTPSTHSSSTKKRCRDVSCKNEQRRRHRSRSKSPRQSQIPDFYRSRSPTTKSSRSDESEENRSTSNSRQNIIIQRNEERLGDEKRNNEKIIYQQPPPEDTIPAVQEGVIYKSSNNSDYKEMSRKERKKLKKMLRKKQKSEIKMSIQTNHQSTSVVKADGGSVETNAPPKKIVIPSPLEFLKSFCKPTIKKWEGNGAEVTNNPENIFGAVDNDSCERHSNYLDDEEMDAGKTKKVKKKNSTSNQYRNEEWNPFQYALDSKRSK